MEYETIGKIKNMIRPDGSFDAAHVELINDLVNGDTLVRIWLRQLVVTRLRKARQVIKP